MHPSKALCYISLDLKLVMRGDNTDSNKGDVFDRRFKKLLVVLVGSIWTIKINCQSPRKTVS
jgi:hypothetical protein